MLRRRGGPAALLILHLLALLLPAPALVAAEADACAWPAATCDSASPGPAFTFAATPASDLRLGTVSWRGTDGTAGPHTAAGDADATFARRRVAQAASAAASTSEHRSTRGPLRFGSCGRRGAPPRAPPAHLRIPASADTRT